MSSLNIVIVHDATQIREYVSLMAFSLSPGHSIFSHDGQSFYQPPEWKYACSGAEQEVLKNTTFDLAIAHADNRAEAEALEPKSLVLFGGHGEAGDSRAIGCEYIYQDIYGKVTRKEKLEIFGPLVAWCLGGERPRFLDPPDAPAEYSLSLSLLCQGYLAQYAGLPENQVGSSIDTKGCADVGKALMVMGWVEDEAATKVSQTVEDLGLNPAESLPEVDFWRTPFEGEKSLREGLEEECRSLRKNVHGKIQDGTIQWNDNEKLPKHTNELVAAIESGNVSQDKFVCVVARAFLELNLLLKAV